jgi:FMN-dependent NADH-azoreductase
VLTYTITIAVSKGEDNLALSSWHQRELDRADAIVLVCSLENEDIEASVQQWLITIHGHTRTSKIRAGRHLPVVLAATKSDLLQIEGVGKIETLKKDIALHCM